MTVISEFRSDRIFKYPYQDQVREASTDANQNEKLKEEISIETNPIEKSEPETGTDLMKKIKKRRERLSYSRHINQEFHFFQP